MARFLTDDIRIGDAGDSVTRGPDGRLAVASGGDGQNWLQLYDINGQPDGPPIQLPAGQGDPQIARSGDGYVLFNFTSADAIYGQRLDASGAPVGDPYILYENNDLKLYDAIGLPNGDTVVLFSSDDSPLLGMVIGQDGVEKAYFTLGRIPLDAQLQLSADGGFIVTLQDGVDASGRYGFTSDGQLDTRPGALDPAPMIAELADGGYVQLEIRYGILVAREYNADGSARTGEFLIDDFAGDHLNARIHADADGGWSVVWTERDGANFATYLRRFDAFSADAVATSGDDDLAGTNENDTLLGLDGRDVLFGFDGNDTLNGGAGADQMYGGAGDDIYIVDHEGDVVVEFKNQGFDQIFTSVSYVLDGGHVERLVLTGSAAINAFGDHKANRLVGNDGDNLIDGGAGADQMAGGAGDDIYYVDNVRDRVYENAGEGFDQIVSSVSYSLVGTYVERLVLTGTANLNATGNSQANRLVGNDGNNVLDGARGADQMAGGRGDDTYYVDNARDRVYEIANEGDDTVVASVSYVLTGIHVETLVLTGTAWLNATGNSLDNTLIGNAGANTLRGLGGDDVLIGAQGGDVLVGGAGADRYVYLSAADSTLAHSDTIISLAGGDRIDLSAIDANRLNDGDDAFVLIDAFTNQPGQATLVYEELRGRTALLLDIDGDGQADMRIWIQGEVTTLDTSLF